MRKRVIFLGISLGILVNQFMLYECNKVLSEPNYNYTATSQINNAAFTKSDLLYDENAKNSPYNQTHQSTVKRPEWYEFAPLEFENPYYSKVPFKNASFDNNYWYKRKQNFEYYLQQCDRKPDEYRDICYAKLRNREIQLTNSWEPTSVQCQRIGEQFRQEQREQEIINAITRPIQVNHSGAFDVYFK